jgi:DNA protecting protein DprA
MAQDQVQEALAGAKTPGAEKIAREIADAGPVLTEQGQKKAEELSARGIHIVPGWQLPPQLREIPDAPRWLFVQGNLDVLQYHPSVAAVGTRKATLQGRRAAIIVTRMLAAYPILLVSGLAEGIDEEAHKASLQAGVLNLAFLGHGINLVFPAQTKEIRRQIVERGGAVATEYLPDEHYTRSYFIERNRLQAAMADIIIPVEAGLKGGTAHTIRFARKYRRAILGISWKNANGLLEELQRDGYPVIDIFSPRGRRELDGILRELAERAGHETYAFSRVERRLVNEAESRKVRSQDIKRLTETLHNLRIHPEGGEGA